MKRMNPSYRLQIIKEVAIRNQAACPNDPMARHISHILESRPGANQMVEHRQEFSGNHYDEHVGGWVSNLWGQK